MRWSTLARNTDGFACSNGAVDASRVETFIRKSFGPLDLFRISEREQWSAEAIALKPDREQWESIVAPRAKSELGKFFRSFLIGEYTGLDLLAPIQLGCPQEDDLLFLATQVLDEARHAHFMIRICDELLGDGAGIRGALVVAWAEAGEWQRKLSELEADTMRRLSTAPDYKTWIEAVTLFHLVTEGLLAIHHQKALVQVLTASTLLPGVRSGFVAMLRDEGRHVSYGLHALRRAVAEGYETVVLDTLALAIPLALHTVRVETRGVIADALLVRLAQIGCSEESVSQARSVCAPLCS